MTIPFEYPALPHVRRHGPIGYAHYSSYRPWLRDEFGFRCVYCLTRESWGAFRGLFAIDHLTAVCILPDAGTRYENLVYACNVCNSAKADRPIPDPLSNLLGDTVEVRPDGAIVGHTPAAGRLIEILGLDNPRMVEWRELINEVVSLSAKFDRELYLRLLSFPLDLPRLSTLRPPEGNTRPEGIEQSHFSRRQRGELPETY